MDTWPSMTAVELQIVELERQIADLDHQMVLEEAAQAALSEVLSALCRKIRHQYWCDKDLGSNPAK